MDDEEFEHFGIKERHSSNSHIRKESGDRKTGVYEI